MTALIWIFGVSAALAILMVSYRKYELVSGKSLISNEKREVADGFVQSNLRKIYLILHKFSRSTMKFLHDLPDMWHDFSHWIWKSISGKIDDYFEKIRSRKGVGKKGSISLYWQDLEKKREEE